MILIAFGLTSLWVERRHEFGHEALPKILQIDLIFCTIFICTIGTTVPTSPTGMALSTP